MTGFLPELHPTPRLGWAGGPGEALLVGAGRGKAVNWFGTAGLSCRCRWPPAFVLMCH